MTTQPLVSIGMPVYNSERYLRLALDSLLAQEYTNFELIISDNASTDTTAAICQEYAARDARIRYYRAEVNHGAVWNFNRTFELSQAEYFMWAAFDDLRHPQFISRCLSALQARPCAVLCCSTVQFIDEVGQEVPGADAPPYIPPVGRNLHRRVRAIGRAYGWYDIYGLIRADALRQTRLMQPVWGMDVVLLLELCLRGEVILIPEKLFRYRFFVQKTVQDSVATLTAVADPAAISVSVSEMALALVHSIWLAPLPCVTRCSLVMQFLMEFCVVNIHISLADAGWSVARALAKRRPRHFIGLLLLAALVYGVALINYSNPRHYKRRFKRVIADALAKPQPDGRD